MPNAKPADPTESNLPMPSIFIVGAMGAGKPTVGKLLARHFARLFVDSDQHIEQQTGADIPWIFAKEGEAGVRERERRAIEELTAMPGIVLATGGGAVLNPHNREHLKNRGITIYLQASIDVQLARTAKDKSRPLLQSPNPRQVLEDLNRIRSPLYQEVADVSVRTADVDARQILKTLGDALAEQYPQWVEPY